MNCEFCHNPLVFSHHENLKEVEVYDCNHCPIQVTFYFFIKDGARVKTLFLINKSGKLYTWCNNYLNNTSSIKVVDFDKNNPADCVLMEMPKIIPVSPENVVSKFSTYLMFI